MLHLLLTVAASLAISLILKVNENRGGDRLVVAGMNYIVATLLAVVMNGGDVPAPAWSTAGLGAIAGVGFVGGFLVLMRALKVIGLAIPVSAARLSTVIPIIGSFLLFDEAPTAMQLVGIALGLVSFVVLGAAQRRSGTAREVGIGGIGLLLLVFIVVGLADFSMKVVHESGTATEDVLVYVFGAAVLLCWLGVAIARRAVVGRDLLLGMLLGVPNYFSSYFLLRALRELPAAVVFPVMSAGGVVAVTVAAILIWKEYPSRTGWLGIALAAVAVLILGLEQ